MGRQPRHIARPLPTEREVAAYVVGLSELQKVACRHVFDGRELARLIGEFELTPRQIECLSRVPIKVKDALTLPPEPQTATRAHLRKLKVNLKRSSSMVERWEAEGAPFGAAEALAQLNSALQSIGPSPVDEALPTRLVGTEVVKLASRIAERALECATQQAKRTRPAQTASDHALAVRASANAIALIVDALREPADSESLLRADALPVQRSRRMTGSFYRLAELIFATALDWADGEVNPSRSIEAYRARLRDQVVKTPVDV